MHFLDLEEDYETKYPDGWRPDPWDNRLVPVGRCETMCSLEEMLERENNRRLHKYEIKPGIYPPQVNKQLAVKEYKRSCVGREFTKVIELRPWSVLKKTLDYLLLDICQREDDWMFVCDFVFDRLKAVRQDIIIQRIEGKRYIEVLEGSIRFLIYSLYRLTCTLQDFSVVEPMRQVICLDGPVSGLNNYDLNVVREMKLTINCLRDCLNSLIIQYQENVPNSENRALFEAINLIINLPFLHGHHTNQTDFLSNTDLSESEPMFKTVFRIYRDHLVGNHFTALKKLPSLVNYPLIILAYAPALAQLQVKMIQMLRKAYSSPGANTSSISYLCNLICPRWLETNEESRLLFGKFIAVQFGFYDPERNLCDYKLNTEKVTQLPRNFREKLLLERKAEQLKSQTLDDNETRIYALQMIISREWSFFRDITESCGIADLLKPKQ